MDKTYQRVLLSSAQRWFMWKNWLLQKDNNPNYRSRLCTTWK